MNKELKEENKIYDIEEGCNELERQITLDGRIAYQDSLWHLFRIDGESIASGRHIMELIENLSKQNDQSEAPNE